MKYTSAILCFVLTIFLACNGGTGDDPSGTNGATTGTVDEAAETLAVAARETTKQILASESDAAGFALLPSTTVAFPEVDVTKDPLSVLNSRFEPYKTTTETVSEDGECGGTLDRTTVSSSEDETIFPIEIDADWVYNNYCSETDDGNYWIRFNGSMTYYLQYTSQDNATRHYYYELSYTSNIPFLPSGTLSYAKYCTIEDGIENCNVGVYESETTTYYTADVSVSGNASSGYDISYILSDNVGHSYTVTFTDLRPCDDGGISSGSGVVNFNGEEIRIEFTDCGEYLVTHDGVTESFSIL